MHLIKVDCSIPRDIRYATTQNFTRKVVYARAECYLMEPAARTLAAAQQEFCRIGFSLKVFDGYRPLSVQKIFWDLVPNEQYVANPAKGSRHNRGCAIDVTLIDAVTKKELDMGTDFDDFTEKAHRDFIGLSEEAIANRKLLESIMHKHGFIGWHAEWWHFDFKDWEHYPILDISFEELAKR